MKRLVTATVAAEKSIVYKNCTELNERHELSESKVLCDTYRKSEC